MQKQRALLSGGNTAAAAAHFDESRGFNASKWDEDAIGADRSSGGRRRRHQEDLAVSHLNNQTIQSNDYGKRRQTQAKNNDTSALESSALSTSRIANREVLSNLCDKIQSVSGLMNGHVRRMFNLEAFVEVVEVDEDEDD